MKCPNCQFENPNGMKYCGECGQEIHPSCPRCGFTNPLNFKFCGNCGCGLSAVEKAMVDIAPQPEEIPVGEDYHNENACYGPDSERKCVTVMFSDLTGYTEMSEKLDPEEVKEITSAIFGELTKIIEKYDGFIEKYIGDAILVVFGAKEAFEDSALRAIKAAREIHAHVESVSPKYEELIGRALTMHTGIKTGVVVTGEINFEKGTHGLVGDTINTAARIMSVSQSGEIIVDKNSFTQTEAYFEFEALEPVMVKGKKNPIPIYRVTKSIHTPQKLHRLHGLRSELIGRSIEMQILEESIENLHQGQTAILSVSGTAGTGKSRLVLEFKGKLDLNNIQWFDAHAYPHTQNTPYSPLIDLFTRTFRIEEGDGTETIQGKVENGLKDVPNLDQKAISYILSLFSIETDETHDASPEFWQKQLFKMVRKVIEALSALGPTIICIEDLQWADSSFIQLIKRISTTINGTVLFIFTYRPHFSLFDDDIPNEIKDRYRDIPLKELSARESSLMIKSLLRTEDVPKKLYKFAEQKAQGNPFYIEEMINSLIESDIIIHDDGNWLQTRQITEVDIPVTIHGLLAARVDRLEKRIKRILQEASVIGRSFLFRILERISDINSGIDQCLRSLVNLDLIIMQSIEPDLEYIFKHALIQEVVYNGLLIKERKEIHERIASSIEQIFKDRLPEFYENLAFHFRLGKSGNKAVEYMIKAGEKSYSRFSLEEAHQYFSGAYNLLIENDKCTEKENQAIVDLIIKWGNVLNCRGDFNHLEKLLIANERIAKSIDDKERLGMFYAWFGYTLRSNEKLREGYLYLIEALQIGEEISNQKIVGYACCWLTWCCADMGRLDEAIKYGKRAKELIPALNLDRDFIRFTLAGLGMSHFFKGDCQQVFKIGNDLLGYGKQKSDIRCMTQGYNIIGWSYYVAGNYDQAIQNFQIATQISADLVFEITAHLFLGISYILSKRLDEAAETFDNISHHIEKTNAKFIGNFAQFFFSVYSVSQGELEYGLLKAKNVTDSFLENGSMYRYASANHVLGRVYSSLAVGDNRKSISLFVKNLFFLIRNIPFASKKAVNYFDESISVAKKIGAKGILGQAYLDLGLLYKAKKRNHKAQEYILEAVKIFDECNADVFQKIAKESLPTL